MRVHFSSQKQDWTTPPELFEWADKVWGPFNLDAAATKETALCARYLTPEDDALSQDWSGRVWLNSPYGREIGAWVAKAHRESLRCEVIVQLLPARPDTAYWHDLIWAEAAEILFLRGRLRFGGAPHSAPFPSALVVWRAAQNQQVCGVDWRVGEYL